MRKVLVTGGNGFIGKWTCEELTRRGYEVLVLDHHTPVDASYEVFLGDMRDASAVTEAAAHVDGIIHLAGVLGTQETIKNPRPAAETNILGGLNVLEAAAQYDLPMVNIAVGNYFENNTYSISKSTVERFATMFAKERGTRVTSVRGLNAYGPRQSVAAPFGNSKVRKIMPSFICRALTGQAIEIYGDGTQVMDMVWVGDVARDLVDALEQTYINGAYKYVLESGTGLDITVNDVAKSVWNAIDMLEFGGKDYAEHTIRHLPMRPGETPGVVVKAANPYGEDYLPLDEGVLRTVQWFKDTRGKAWDV